METDHNYYLECKRKVEKLEKDWKAKNLNNETALQSANEWRKTLFYYVINEQNTTIRARIQELLDKVYNLINEIKEEMKNVYIVTTNNNQTIVCSDESLVKKCIERLGKDVSVAQHKAQICQSEEDINKILLEIKKEENKYDGPILQVFGETYE